MPLHICNRLAYMDMIKPTKEEAEGSTLPHVIFTCNRIWDPHSLDNEIALDNINDANSLIQDNVEDIDATDYGVSDKG